MGITGEGEFTVEPAAVLNMPLHSLSSNVTKVM
jgi:hypothetical protein